jgi:hypothetical protein
MMRSIDRREARGGRSTMTGSRADRRAGSNNLKPTGSPARTGTINNRRANRKGS